MVQVTGGGDISDPQWPFRQGYTFAVNPLNSNQLLISSAAGRVFSTETGGDTWSEIGNPAVLDGTNAQALAFGAPLPTPPGGSPNTNDYLFAGTVGGHVYVTFTGGGGSGNQWTNISTGLDGSPVEGIVTNPESGNFEAYAVTQKGVYHMADASAGQPDLAEYHGQPLQHPVRAVRRRRPDTEPASVAVEPSGRLAVCDSQHSRRHFRTDAPDSLCRRRWRRYRSIDNGQNWSLFPDTTLNGSPQGDGGGLPNAAVTSLSLSLGLVNPTTGRPDVSTGPNVLMASTYGGASSPFAWPRSSSRTKRASPRVWASIPGATPASRTVMGSPTTHTPSSTA